MCYYHLFVTHHLTCCFSSNKEKARIQKLVDSSIAKLRREVEVIFHLLMFQTWHILHCEIKLHPGGNFNAI